MSFTFSCYGCLNNPPHIQPLPNGRKRTSPIYHFFQVAEANAQGEKGDAGDMHYQCFHGDRKVVTVGAKSKSSTNCLCFPSDFGFCAVLTQFASSRDMSQKSGAADVRALFETEECPSRLCAKG